MDPRQLTFARKTEALDPILSRVTSWGLRDNQLRPHADEQEFELFYPTNAPAQRCADPAGTAATGQRQEITQTANAYRGVAAQLVARRGALSITVSADDGATVAEQSVTVARGTRATTVDVATDVLPVGLESLLVRLRLSAPSGLPLTDSTRITLAGQPHLVSPRLARASPSTRQRFVPTADSRFRRGERLRVEVPLASPAEHIEATLLDRAGGQMKAIPVNAVLAAPDEAGTRRSLTAFRVVP